MVFPFKTVALRYTDLLMAFATILVAVWLIGSEMLQGGTMSNMLRGVTCIAIAKALTVFQRMNTARTVMEREMQRVFAHKTKDNDRGALTYLVDIWETQELKEMLLGYTYCVLLNEVNMELSEDWLEGVDQQEIAEAVQTELRDKLQLHTAFDINNAIYRLKINGLVTVEDNRLVPVTVAEAIALLKDRWRTYI